MKTLFSVWASVFFLSLTVTATVGETDGVVTQPHTPTLIYYLTGLEGQRESQAIGDCVSKLKSAKVVEVNTNRGFVRVRFDSHVVSYHQVAQSLIDAGNGLGKHFDPCTIFFVTEYARSNNAANVDRIFAGKRLNTRVKVTPLDKSQGKFLVHFLPLKVDPAVNAPQGFNGGHLHHPISDPPPRGLALTSGYASKDDSSIPYSQHR